MKLSSFNLVGDAEEQDSVRTLIDSFNQTARTYPSNSTVAELFSEGAVSQPETIAITFNGEALTYGDLDRRSTSLAHYLTERLSPVEGSLIAVGLERGTDLVVALLGILKSGAAYLPLDLDYPEQRLRFMLEHSHARAVISRSDLADKVPSCGAEIVLMDVDQMQVNAFDNASMPAVSANGSSLAYVIYTSGSTGQPKAVAVPHRAIARLVCNTDFVDLSPNQVFLQYAPISFDAATFEIWGPLLNGARLAIAPSGQQSLVSLGTLIESERVTTLWLTAGLFNVMIEENPEALRPLRQLLVGGEALSVTHIRKALELLPDCRLVNGYGPTENTTFSCCYRIEPADYKTSIPIGPPIANSTAYILDEERRLLPPGTTGELFLGGDGLAIGYWNDPQLTAERFEPSPFAAGQRLYRTGDLACWRADGTIDYLGRVDDQIKIRGFRIEPGEIEAALMQHPAVSNAVVGTHERGKGQRMLVAHFTANAGVDADEVRGHLLANLPEFMVPSHIIEIETIPLNPNGKVDRSALPAPTLDVNDACRQDALPSGDTESRLVDIWRELLELDEVGTRDDFFGLGGHSLLAAKLVAVIEKDLGITLPLTAVFTHPTIHSLAGALLDDAQFGNESVDQPRVALNGVNGRRAVFALPPGTSDALSYGRLASQLGAFDVHAFNFIEAESRLGDYADLIVEADPAGPYLLFGYSAGGNLAFHVALELERRGRRVSDIVMLDSSRFLRRFAFPEAEPDRLAQEFLGADSVMQVANSSVLRDKVRRRIRRYYAFLSSIVDDEPVAANIHLIRSPGSDEVYRGEDGAIICSQPAWADITRGTFTCHDGTGGHGEMLLEPCFRDNARLLEDIFKQAISRAR
jgi:amino acid adenylation domain-containing protein